MIRIATADDAEQLGLLNDEFNGEGETTPEWIRTSLLRNRREIVVVAEEGGKLAGFVCVQLKRSFCYSHCAPEVTEVYVRPDFRRRGIASAMLLFAEECCARRYPVRRFELLTGSGNAAARSAYRKLGYAEDREIHLTKRVGSEEDIEP